MEELKVYDENENEQVGKEPRIPGVGLGCIGAGAVCVGGIGLLCGVFCA